MVVGGDPELRRFYEEQAQEAERLELGRGVLERVRTQRMLERVLPPPPARVLDVGGGPGVYSAWMARAGHDVKLVDVVPSHVEQARAASATLPERPFEVLAGDARRLGEADGSADAVLLLGPLYHLQEREERLVALREAHRVLRDGGVLAAAGISRFAGLIDAMRMRRLDDTVLAKLVAGPIATGRHDARFGFTTAYLHRPDELRAELGEAGFGDVVVRGIEGPGWLLMSGEPDPHREPPDSELLAAAVRCAEAVEEEPTLIGVSLHLLATGRRP